MKKVLPVVVFLILFVLPVSAQGPVDWANLDLTYKESPHDSVDWSNIDLTKKPPAPKTEDREWPGEKDGNSGPVIVQGKEKRDLVIVIFDPCGVPVAHLTRKEVTDQVLVEEIVRYAHLRGEEQLLKKIKETWWGAQGQEDLSRRIEDLTAEIVQKKKDLVSKYGEDIFRVPEDFIPEIAVILRQGIMPDAFGQPVQDIIVVLNRGLIRDKFKRQFADRPWVYGIEDIFLRLVQERNIEPNDPLYLRAGKAKGRPSGGFSIGLGGISFGKKRAGVRGGLSLGKGKKSSGANDQWALRYVGYKPTSNPDSAWNIESGEKKNVVVAVIDSGLDFTHPDGPEYIWQNEGEIPDNGIDDDGNGYVDDVRGWNFIEDNQDLTDKKGHGTFVAGIISAKRNNGIGIAGINPGAQIMVLKVADRKGVANSLNIWRALRYAADKGAQVINISLGGREISKLEQLGINYAHSKGALVVVAGGNQAGNTSDYGPVANRRALVVGALNIEGTRSVINNKGPNIALLAPGEDIYSLHSKDAEWEGPAMNRERLYFKQSGTSFSAPIVSGTASLLFAKNLRVTNRQVEDILLDTANDLEISGWDSRTGAGVLNAYKALLKADDPSGILTVMPTEVAFRKKGHRIIALDIFGIVRGSLDYYEVFAGRGIKPDRLKKVAGPFKKQVEYGFITRIDGKLLRGENFTIQIRAYTKDGKIKQATLRLDLKKDRR